jgi:hypothetical protein
MDYSQRRETIVLGLGAMGRSISTLLLRRGYRIAGAFDPAWAGRPLNGLAGLDRADPALVVVADPAAALAAAAPGAVVFQAAASSLRDLAPGLRLAIDHGHDVISIGEEMAFPEMADAALTAELDAAAKARGVRILGTGVNPGFAMDVLVLALTVPCGDVRRIFARRTNSLSAFGPTVLYSQGVGTSPVEFDAALAAGTISGHVGFPQSIALIARHLGWRIDRIEENREPIIAGEPRRTEFISIAAGQVAGCLHTVSAFSGGREVVRLEHPQQICPEAAGVVTSDRIEIEGDQRIEMSITPEIRGGDGTAAAAVNALERLRHAPPGIVHVTDLPLNSPYFFQGDMP